MNLFTASVEIEPLSMRIKLLIIIFVIACASSAFASSTITLSPSGDGIFLLKGSDIEGASGFEFTITYDAAVLGNPRVEQGSLISGAMMAVNANVPGAIRIAIVRISPVRGSGVIATISFDRKSSLPGRINSLTARIINTDGKPLPAVVQPPDSRYGSTYCFYW